MHPTPRRCAHQHPCADTNMPTCTRCLHTRCQCTDVHQCPCASANRYTPHIPTPAHTPNAHVPNAIDSATDTHQHANVHPHPMCPCHTRPTPMCQCTPPHPRQHISVPMCPCAMTPMPPHPCTDTLMCQCPSKCTRPVTNMCMPPHHPMCLCHQVPLWVLAL